MSNVIKLLPDSVVNQIAAGQVVHRPASVIKEMMENSIDAGSRNVRVNFRGAGLEMIQIADDGKGMSPADARLAFERHSTSKIGCVEDMYSLLTFGFRGEALASIAAVAEVELQTREAESQLGTRIAISGGKFLSQESVATPEGTQFAVRNLFYNTPAQRRFLDKSSTEERHIMAEFNRVALCHPEVAFSLFKNDAPLLNLPTGTLKSRVAAIAGRHTAATLLDVSTTTTLVGVEGFVSLPEGARQRNSDQYLFVNGRYFRSAYFNKAIVSAFNKLIPTGAQPSYFIYLTVAPERIDVNIHPQKTDIKFDDQSAIWQIINAAVRESLAKTGVVPMMDLDPQSDVEIPVRSRNYSDFRIPRSTSNPDYNPFSEQPATRAVPADAPQEDELSVMGYIVEPEAVQGRMEIEGEAIFTGLLPLSNRYAAANMGGNLVVVDIVRAWESILFDKYRVWLDGGSSVSQRMLFPEEIALSSDDAMLLRESEAELSACGFEFELRDEHTLQIFGVPADFTPGAAVELLYDMLDALRDESSLPAAVKSRRLAMTIARSGAALKTCGHDELTQMLVMLDGCSHPKHTPSGKHIILVIDEEEIKKRMR
ncbi:MAG: DNA mismatch repair endonuclease MutL [Rikenellaceae bacterium]|jgi:DNA mismatch repair protein MutL|nr:DNA mismatch repair endonuclease MutL [Rikenellaceae bacterium]